MCVDEPTTMGKDEGFNTLSRSLERTSLMPMQVVLSSYLTKLSNY